MKNPAASQVTSASPGVPAVAVSLCCLYWLCILLPACVAYIGVVLGLLLSTCSAYIRVMLCLLS